MPDYKKLFYDSQVDLLNIEEALEELLYQVRLVMQRAEEEVIANEYGDEDNGEDAQKPD